MQFTYCLNRGYANENGKYNEILDEQVIQIMQKFESKGKFL